MSATIDPRITYLEFYLVSPPGWVAQRVQWFDGQEQSPDGLFQGMAALIWARCLKDGKPVAGVRFRYGFPTYNHPDDTDTRLTDTRGLVNFNMTGDGWDNDLQRGLYWMRPENQKGVVIGDVVDHMGIAGHHHATFAIDYIWSDEAPPPPPPTPGPDLIAIAADLRFRAGGLSVDVADLLAQAHALDGR